AITNLRFIDPEIVTEINENKISGKKTMKYLVIAQEKGVYSIPAIAFSFFDTSQKRYVTIRSKSYTITVEEGDRSYIPASAAQSLILKEGSDIGFIITETSLKSHHLLLQSFYYWLLVFLLFMTIPITVIYSREREKLIADSVYLRERQAERILRRYMKQAAEQARKGDPGFYTSVANGLSNFLADKLGMNRGSETEEILNKIRHRNLPEELVEQIEYLFTACNRVRFMPGGIDNADIVSDLAKVKSVFADLGRRRIRG
ncbi:MAG: BatD family protein, partial [Candidatus Cloacimonetes bacterium]|nr:BatD family protein [Candidatus Cloacimonadota bacterium]